MADDILRFRLQAGPVLRTEEGQENAVLCTDQESLFGGSEDNRMDCGVTILDSYVPFESYLQRLS